MSTNLSTLMNEQVNQKITENQIAVDWIYQLLANSSIDDPTKLYAQVIYESITELREKVDKTAKDYDALGKRLDKLNGLIGITSNHGYRMTPVEPAGYNNNDL